MQDILIQKGELDMTKKANNTKPSSTKSPVPQIALDLSVLGGSRIDKDRL